MPSNGDLSRRRGPEVNEIMCPKVLDTESFAVIREEWDGDIFRHVNKVTEKKSW